MKDFYFITLLLCSVFSQAQIVDIPDANFKNTLVNVHCVDTNEDGFPDSDVDTNDDGEIQESEAEAVLWLLVNEREIDSLEGIEYFINLEWLNCINNNLTELNVTQNINLQHLECYSNQLTSLDVSQNQNLLNLYCQSNQITNLDVSQNQNLLRLWCSTNQLSSLYINNGNNINLSSLITTDNPNLICIQVDDVNYANNQNCDDNYWCIDDWTSFNEFCSFAIEDFNKNSIALFPNPVRDILTIESLITVNLVRVHAVNGSLIKETSNSSINVSELPKGLYFVQINIEGNTFTKKFIKK
ncbi:MAG: T9SS type A sorting domain-containing protein [Flavobacteriaceae bacterium]|nr:T9SS type A sorting domain-containing protein [Flavobacteriaceae bacterium]